MKIQSTAQIIEHYGRRFVVRLADQTKLEATTRRKRVDYACGDEVDITVLNHEQAVIENYRPRQSLLFRQDAYRTKLIAANVTQIVFIIAAEPSPNEDLLQRALLAAEVAGIKISIVINKSDLNKHTQLQQSLQLYAQIGYSVIEISALTNDESLRVLLRGYSNIFLGQSGMGKSTLTNALLGGDYVKIGAISTALDSGKHTTTHTRLFDLDEETTLIDSPGLQSFGLNHIELSELLYYFPDMRHLIGQCRFHNCTHRKEPGCALKKATENGEIEQKRLNFLQSISDELTRKNQY